MTPEEFKDKYKSRLVNSYMADPDKVLLLPAYQSLNASERTSIQRALEANNASALLRYLNRPRSELATEMADTRLDEILADGKIDLETEIDELL